MTLYYKEEVKNNGLPGYRYWGTNETFPGDGCYCIDKVCAPLGLVNAETCRMGAPAFVSFPHFLHADPFLLDAFEGVSPPDPDKHSFVLDMIPVSLRILKNVKEAYLPLLWFEEEAVIPDYMARQLQVLLVIMNTPTVYIVLGVILVLGVIGATLVTTRHYKKAKRDRERASKS
ncbi:Scavenger receptor class B member 1 [Portunus trituberculatus]|uniref:Scavenger receptor class B member 1 n=1 Tax=Portunus trituberculatus TaxID=210409 RepID=A0A5B7G9Q3_PORTR|nr:Scavenger receptor class B member 1 [Portunus trituberculatus]